jgi:hypothetical protein
MTSKVIPLDTSEIMDYDWGQYVIIDFAEEPISNLAYLTTTLIDLEEGNLKEDNDKNCNKFCTIC